MYSIHNEGKSVVAERFIRTLKKNLQIYYFSMKCITSVSIGAKIIRKTKKVLWLKNLKILCREHMLFIILTVKKLLEHFMKKNCKKKIRV